MNDGLFRDTTSMKYLFARCRNFRGSGLSSWNMQNVTNCTYMFYSNSNFSENIGNWNVQSVKIMERMFQQCKIDDISFEQWNVESLENAKNFLFYSTLPTTKYDQILQTWS